MTDALALWPQVRLVEAQLEEDAQALARLADWCLRFSPAIAVDAPDGVLLDIQGCAHLWGGEEAMACMLVRRLREDKIPARIGVADTFGVAWALARYGGAEICIAPSGEEISRLAPLPVAALALAPEAAAQLRRLGLKTIDQVMALPRASLRKRFGVGMILQLARALGEEEPALTFRLPPTPWIERAVFAEPISAPESMARVVFDLAERLCARLDERGQGARRFEAVFHRVDHEAAACDVRAALPLREPKRLVALFAPKLELIDPGFGVEIVTLRALRVQRLAHAQTDLEGANQLANAAELAPFVDRLINRFGADRVWRATVQESYVPERAVARVAPLSPPAKREWAPNQPRPVRLFKRPQPIEAMAVAPDDPPFMFRWRKRLHRVRNAEGPERIAAEWWRKPWAENEIDRVRDYYCVEDESGARFWVFRTGLYGGERAARWWLHGLFA